MRQVHESGKYGSIGYRYAWREAEARRLVLRTHTTAVSAAMLRRLARRLADNSTSATATDPNALSSSPPLPPAAAAAKPFSGSVRLFSIDRVFRNETVDATHLAEFHQVEGVLATGGSGEGDGDGGLTLGAMAGFLRAFFARLGVRALRFKPAYNPYTEPSMEVFGWHAGLRRWVEIGNSGLFRPEMLAPLGLPPHVRVAGWGLSLERPTMIKYGVRNIRELLGHRVDLHFVERNPAVRLEKD